MQISQAPPQANPLGKGLCTLGFNKHQGGVAVVAQPSKWLFAMPMSLIGLLAGSFLSQLPAFGKAADASPSTWALPLWLVGSFLNHLV